MEASRRYRDKDRASESERAPFVRAKTASHGEENKAYDTTEKASNPRLESKADSSKQRKRRSSVVAEVSLTVREEKVEFCNCTHSWFVLEQISRNSSFSSW